MKIGFWFSLLLAFLSSLRAADRQNFLILLVDDMGYSDLDCYGSEIPTSHLAGLAANGIRYTQIYKTSKCYPIRAALLTGDYLQHTDREISGTTTVGEVLRTAGYHTWWSGKHHARFNPHRQRVFGKEEA